jgi:replicative DNA helicase
MGTAKQPHYSVAADLFSTWRDDVLTGEPPTRWPLGTGCLDQIELSAGQVLLLGGAPGAGKTAFTMQLVTDGLRLTPTLRALVCNVESPPQVMLDRQLARLSGIDATTIRQRQLGATEAERIAQAMETLEAIAPRLAFVQPPYDLTNVALAADAFEADVIVLDYAQRLSVPGKHSDKRNAINALMDYIRQFAERGVGVIVIAAVGRVKDKKGRSSYASDGLNLASFRESSEIEYGCDSAYLLIPSAGEKVIARHVKNRHGPLIDLTLTFDRGLQRFSDAAGGTPWTPDAANKSRVQAALRELWNRTPPAGEKAT